MSHVSSTKLPMPYLPRPPGGTVDQGYVDQLLVALQQALDILASEQPRRFSEIALLDIAGTGNQLRVGEVFQDSGILKIVRAGDIFAGTLVGTMSLGSVTVTVS